MKILSRLNNDELKKELLKRVDIDANGCWNYSMGLSKFGYAHITFNNTTYKGHRLYFEIFNEQKLETYQHILHSCDNKACCNPEHLRIGTNLENSIDTIERIEINRIAARYNRPKFRDIKKLASWILDTCINKDECMIWPFESKKEYPYMKFKYKTYAIHQIIYLANNAKLEENQIIRHTCNNNYCCNPKHLVAGTRQQNGIDSRHYHKNTKLDEYKVRTVLLEFRDNLNNYKTKTELHKRFAEEYGVSINAIKNLCLGVRWKDIYKEIIIDKDT